MNIINSFLREVAPKLAIQRLKNQVAYDILDKGVRKYEGAGRGRRFSDNNLQGYSQNAEVNSSLLMLRTRSRDANKNNPYAKNGTRRIANNVIGTGILANPVGKTSTSSKTAKKLWEDWADGTLCDFDNLQNFYGLQLLVMKTVIKSGECYVRKILKKADPKSLIVPLELQVLDPDFIDHEKNKESSTENYIISGVEFNQLGKRVGYWVFSRHPKEVRSESKLIPAEEILHIFEIDDPGQVHGIPFNSSIILRMQDFDEFEDAQLMKQKIAACFAAFITKPDATSGMPVSDGTDVTEKLSPGVIQRLDAGEEITFSSPPLADGFRDFSRQSLQGQAAGMGMSYESFSGDLSGVNFSSGRMGWLEFQRGVEILQWNMIIPMFLNKVWYWFVDTAVLSSKLKTNEVGVTWTAPRREMIDPLKEIQAKIKSIRAGLCSWQDAVRELGYNPEEILSQMIEDKKRFDAAGVMPESDPRYDADKMSVLDNQLVEK